MARGDKDNDILKQITQEVADAADAAPKASAANPDFVEIDGIKYYRDRVQAADPARKIKKLYTNPKRPLEAPVEMELEQIAINVAPYADGITLDSVKYLAGRVYEVPCAVASTMREIIQRTWQHEASTGGAYSNGMGSVKGSASQVGLVAPGIAFG